MKLNAKLLVIAMIIAMIFSVSAVAATSENVTALSSEFTQVPHEQVVSVSEPTVPEVEATDLETSADNIESLSSSDNQVSIKDSDIKEESDIKKGSEDSVLGASTNEDVMEIPNNQDVLSDTIYLEGNIFQSLRDAINKANDGDIIDLQGRTVSGVNSLVVVENKNISIINGIIDGYNVNNPNILDFHYCTLENITFSNFTFISSHDRMFRFDNVYLKNVRFENILGNAVSGKVFVACIYTWKSVFDNVTFKNMSSTYQQYNNEFGVNVVSYHSKFYNCTFQNTKTYQHSAAICVAGVSGNTVDIIDCKFINCSSGIGGAIYVHGTDTNDELHSNIINCDFINCTASEWGGAIGSSQDFLNVENCNFINNTAKQGAAIMIGGITHGLDGDNSQGHNDTIKNCYFYNNIGTEEGGSIHITGHNNTIMECIFDDNFAENGQGAAIYIEGHNSSVIKSNFTNHEAINGTIFIEGNNANIAYSHFDNNEAINSGAAVYIHGRNATIDQSLFTNHISDMGTVYIKGADASVINSKFTNNEASHGGAGVYIEGDNSLVDNSIFENNIAHRHGGAIHTIGNYAKISNSKFYDNDAIPSSSDSDYGLGGAIYIDGNNNEISHSKFEGNTARNGSAIYTKGRELHIENDEFIENRAWSYLLITKANPPEAYWSEDLEFLLNVTLVGGDNIINAIYNDASVGDIYFHNVTYELSDYSLFNASMRTTTDSEIHPIDGVERSNGGRILYQDSREDNQLITLNITYGGAEVFNNNNLITNLYGNVLVPIRKENLSDKQFHPGVYTVNASHPEDMLYTAIENSTTFTVLPHVDVSVTKTSNKDIYIRGENAIFTITVYGVGTNATNVTVRDILPASFKYVDSSATKNSYNPTTNEWYIGFLPHGESETLTLTVQTTELGTYDNVVIVNCTERDWNLSNNRDNKTIHVDLYYTKEANVTDVSAGEYLEYYLRVYNIGDTDYTEEIQIRDVLPNGIKYTGEYTLEGGDLIRHINHGDQQSWYVTNIAAGDYVEITIKCQALYDGIWNNTMYVWDYPPVNATVNVTHNADLRIIKTVSADKVKKRDIINWTLTVINYGPSDASDVVVTDILPYGLEQYGIATVPDGTEFYRESGKWVIGTLKVKDSIQLIIPTRVTISGINITNEANVTSTTPDPNPGNNYDNETVEFYPDVSIEKIVSVKRTSHGDIISWTLTVINNGPHTATSVYVIDQLPAGLRYVNSTRNKGQDYNPVTGRWYIGDLEEDESATLLINTEVTNYEGFISNNATVYASNDGNPENNYDEDFTEVITKADVGIVKIVSNQTSHYGDEIVWTVIVTNYGPNVAENVIVTDFMPAGLKQTKEPYKTKGQVYHLNGNGVWSIGNLAVGESVYIEITTLVEVTDDTLINVVVVNSTTEDPNPSNNRAENGTVVPPECDVEVIKRVSNSTPNKFDEVTWTITIYNEGPDVAENVIVTDVLPDGLSFVSNIPPLKGIYHKDLNQWDVGNLEPGVRYTLSITTRVEDTGMITNEVNITTTTYDRNPENNYDNETINVPAIADLEITKIVSNKNPKNGELINWTITVRNNGPNNARNVYVIDKLPAGLIYVNDTTNGEDYNPISGRWTIGDLEHFDSISLTITTRVNITNETITNVAVVNSTTPDDNPDNNKANNTTFVDPVADLAIVKSVSNVHPAFNEEFSYYILVTNNGPDTAVNTYVVDKLPSGLIYVSDDSDGAYDNETGIWKVGNLSAKEGFNTRKLEIRVKVNVTQPDVITNIANVTSDTPDPDLTNNEDNVTIDVGHLADLEVIKVVSSNTSKYGDEITWTIYVYNHGPNNAIDVYVYDKLPEELIYISSTQSVGSYNHDIGIWEIGDFEYKVDANGNDPYVWLSIITKVNVTNKNITNIAVVYSTTPDSNETNNKGNNTTVVDSNADLEIIKEVSNKNPRFGENITWTITVINHGPNDAKDVYVNDTLPYGLIYQTDDSNGAYNSASGIWTIGTLEKDGRRVLVITTLVNITNTTITNVAVVNSTTPDNNTENNKDENKTSVEPEADLEIIKLVSNKTSKFGDEITWTIIVTNHGPDAAKRVFVRDNFPKELILKGFTKTKGLFDTDSWTWFIEEMGRNETQTLTITAIVNITNGNITNIVNVTNDVYDPNETNNEANNTTAVDPRANLVVVKVVSDKNPKFGDVITWTITVTNKGPDTARNVNVTDKLPAGLIFKGADGNYDETSGLWIVGDLANGESRSLVISTIVNVTNTTVVNIANATSDTPGNSTPGNNTTNVKPMADLEVIKIVSNSTAKKGDIITWTIIVTNHGPDVAENVIVKDKLPNGLTYRNHTGPGLYDPSKGIWNVGNLAKNDTLILVITTVVDISNGTIENIAIGNSTTPDNNTDNNKGNNTTVVSENADLEVIKVVSNKNPHKGDTITWTITVTNHGPDTARNVRVTDKLPAGLIFKGADGNYDETSGLWIVGDLANGESKSLVITTVVNITNTTIRNVANVTSDTPDSNKTNNEGNNTTDVGSEADLIIVKEVSNKNPHKGDIITWTITVTNKGPDTARNVRVTDKLPAGLIFKGADGNYDETSGLWIVGDLANRESKSLVITTVVNITNTTIRNVANVTSDTYDPNETNNKGNNTTDVDPEADLEIIKIVSNKTSTKGDTITWTVVVTNRGPDTALNVYVKDELPNGLVFKSYTKTKGLFDSDDLIWYINSLAKGESATLTIYTLVNVSETSLVNKVNVTNDVYDPNETNNKANNTTVVRKELPADLEVVKVVSNKNPHNGDTITWTITVTNHGQGSAHNVFVTDKLPDGLKFISSNGDYNKDTGVWTIGDLANGESKSLVIRTLVDITNANITNVAVVNSTTPDNNTDNNKDNDTVKIDPEADVKVIKTVSNPKPSKGDTITWTIVVVNLGPDTAENVAVSEELPKGLKLLSAKGSKGKYLNEVWTVGDLKNGEMATLTLTTEVTVSSGNIENVVVATSTTYDPNKTNNRDKEVTKPKSKVKTSADLEVIKVVNAKKVKVGDKIVWTITVINNGPNKASNVKVKDLATGNVEFVSFKASKGSFNPLDGIWKIGSMKNGEAVTLKIIGKALTKGTITNEATVSSDTPDPDKDNNYDIVVTKVVKKTNHKPPAKHDGPSKASAPTSTPHTMHATGNPIVMVILALLAVVGISLRRKN